jgi:predicted transcriptional regulator
LTRLFEKLAIWVGLSENAAPVLMVLFIEKYRSDNRLSSEDICQATGYSRANAGLIISQLESIRIIEGQRDFSQTGRGRKRVLYRLSVDLDEFFELGFKGIFNQLENMMRDVTSIQGSTGFFVEGMSEMLVEMKSEIQKSLERLASTKPIR